MSLECEKHKSRMDSSHEQVDRLSSGESSGGDGASTQTTSSQPMLAVEPRGMNPAIVLGAVAMVIIIVAVPYLALVVLNDERSPSEVYREYVDASNDRDIKRMFDQTVTKLTPDYEDRLANLSQIIFLLDPYITINSLDVTSQDEMSIDQELVAQILTDDLASTLSVTVDAVCYLSYNVSIEYRDIDQTATFEGDIFCGHVSGEWLLIIPGFY